MGAATEVSHEEDTPSSLPGRCCRTPSAVLAGAESWRRPARARRQFLRADRQHFHLAAYQFAIHGHRQRLVQRDGCSARDSSASTEPKRYSRVAVRLPVCQLLRMPVKAAGAHAIANAAEWICEEARSGFGTLLALVQSVTASRQQWPSEAKRQIQFGFHCKEPPRRMS